MTDALLRCKELSKSYQDGGDQVTVLKDIDFALQAGEMVAVVGASGSGKSTLLHLLGGLDKPSSGQLFYKDREMTPWKADKLAQWRNQNLGFVYQFHHLLPEFSALENVAMPQLIAGKSPTEAKQQAEQLLVRVGLEHRLSHRPAQLSGGERQRVAIARAFVNKPQVVLADEPTGNLDTGTESEIIDLLKHLHADRQLTLLVATHDQTVARAAQRVVHLKDGRVCE